MNDENVLRKKAREVIQAEHLPNRPPDYIWGGPGTGARCAICGAATAPTDAELEIEFTRPEREGPASYYVHLRCFSILELERQNRSSCATAHPIGGRRVAG